MTEETTAPATDQNVKISFEQISAAILATIGDVTIPVENLVANYVGKTIAVNQNPETKDLIFSLVDSPVANTEDAPENETEGE